VAGYSLLLMLLAMKTNISSTVRNDVHAYVQLQQQIHEALRKEHPEWVDPDGTCPTCEVYESRLAKLLGVSSPREYQPAA
jgi:hypothetical protein